MTYFNTSSGNYTSTTWPESYVCCCACSICLSGRCCLYPQPNYWPYYYWPYQYYWPTTVSYGVTLKPDQEKEKVDKTWLCAKCGNNGITTRYHKETYDCPYSEWHAPGIKGEHLHHRCTTCGYSWRTPTADAPKEEVKVAVADKEAQPKDEPRCTCPKVAPFPHELTGSGSITWRICPVHPISVTY